MSFLLNKFRAMNYDRANVCFFVIVRVLNLVQLAASPALGNKSSTFQSTYIILLLCLPGYNSTTRHIQSMRHWRLGGLLPPFYLMPSYIRIMTCLEDRPALCKHRTALYPYRYCMMYVCMLISIPRAIARGFPITLVARTVL